MVKMVNFTLCVFYHNFKKRNLKKTQDTDFPFPTLNFDINHDSALLLVPFLFQFQLSRGLGMAWAPGKGLIQSLWAQPKMAGSWQRQGQARADGQKRAETGKNTEFPQRAQKQTLICHQGVRTRSRLQRQGRVSNKLGHKSLKVSSREEMGFQKANKALPEMEIHHH